MATNDIKNNHKFKSEFQTVTKNEKTNDFKTNSFAIQTTVKCLLKISMKILLGYVTRGQRTLSEGEFGLATVLEIFNQVNESDHI